MAKPPQIALIDLDAFFASVECLLDPGLRGKPLVVGGSAEGRGVVAAASYEARARGIHSAMPMAQALRLCPDAVRVPARHGVYREHSQRVFALLEQYTPVIEQVSVDEAYLDLTGTEALHGPGALTIASIQRRVWVELGLPCSLGLATNKLVAKVACSSGKPRGLVVVQPGDEAAFLAPLPVEALPGVGEATGRRLRTMGINTVGDLAQWPEEALRRLLGDAGAHLHRAAQGIDPDPVVSERERRSYSHEETFAHDVGDPVALRRTLLSMSDRLTAHVRRDAVMAQTVRIKLRYGDFHTVTRQVRLARPTDQAADVLAAATALLESHWGGRPLRLLGLALAGLCEHGGMQLDLFDPAGQRRARLSQTLDSIRGRYGSGAITRASLAGGQDTGPDEPQGPE